MNELHLFAGAGGGILGGMLLGHTCVCAVEWDKHARQVLLARQRDKCLPRFPIWDDVQTFDGKPWRGRVDVVCGGFPCQDISAAGKGAGIDGERSGMWRHMARIIGEIRPHYVFVENSPMLTSRGLGRVLGDLAALGYDAAWGVLGACDVGAPHKRERIWILADSMPAWQRREQRESQNEGNAFVADSACIGLEKEGAKQQAARTSGDCEAMADAASVQRNGGNHNTRISMEREPLSEPRNDCGAQAMAAALRIGQQGQRPCWYASDPAEKGEGETDNAWAERIGNVWGIESPVGRVANGVANRMDRLKRIGNGQVASVAALAFKLLSARLG